MTEIIDGDREVTADQALARALEAAEWRGRMDATVLAHTRAMSELATGLHARISSVGSELGRRLENIEKQTTLTNGSVRDLKEWKARVEGSHEGAIQVKAEITHDLDQETQRRQFSLGALIATAGAAGTFIGATAAILSAIHVL